MILERAKPHRCSNEPPGHPAYSRIGLQLVWKAGCGAPRRGLPFTFQSLFLHGCQGPTLSPALEVAGACGQEHIVGVPVQAEDGGANGLLDVLAHPPGYSSQTGRGREEQTGGQPTGLSAPGTSGSHWVLQTTEVPRGRHLGTVSPWACQGQVLTSNVWELYPWSLLNLTTPAGSVKLLTG